ncbi:ABC transporter substrate-binding protein [Viridibacterium curvum]|uniref:ABC transporter substrate-binding protein n=1 Tax=Viridibacterium curvum TaxID=1101404 RepID=UPI0031F13B12
MRTALRGNADHNAILRTIGAQGLVRWTPDFSGVVPNVAERWTSNADVTEYTFYLRRGMRWSDGKPFTADDVLFSMNDLVTNPQFFRVTPSRYVINDKPIVTEKLDDYTVRFRFAGSYRRFPEELATPLGQHPTLFPKHYCGQFHPKYNAKVDDLLRDAKLADWGTLMRNKCGDIELATRWGNPEKPSLDPWLVKEPYTGSSASVLMVRNPYFWQVDPQGQQLPYIDTIQLKVISEVETIVLAAIGGQLDFQNRHIGGVQNRSVLAENAKRNGYTLLSLPELPSNAAGLYLNYSTKNAPLRELFRNKDFRIALSLAMDRKEINELVFLGQGEPWQIGPLRQNRFFNEKLAKQYTERDLSRANTLLDQLGLTARDPDGYRTYAGGKRLAINLSVNLASTQSLDIADLMRKQFKAAGVDLVIQAVERSLHYERARNNDYEAAIDGVAGGLDPTLDMRSILTIHAQESRQSLLWVRWYETNGKSGEEPLPNMKKRLELYDRWQLAKTDKEADALFREILALAAEEFDVIGTIRPGGATALRNTKLINVPDSFPSGWSFGSPGPTLPQQYFYKR